MVPLLFSLNLSGLEFQPISIIEDSSNWYRPVMLKESDSAYHANHTEPGHLTVLCLSAERRRVTVGFQSPTFVCLFYTALKTTKTRSLSVLEP